MSIWAEAVLVLFRYSRCGLDTFHENSPFIWKVERAKTTTTTTTTTAPPTTTTATTTTSTTETNTRRTKAKHVMMCLRCNRIEENKRRERNRQGNDNKVASPAKKLVRERMSMLDQCKILRQLKENARNAVLRSLNSSLNIKMEPAPMAQHILDRFVGYYNSRVSSMSKRMDFETRPPSGHSACDVSTSFPAMRSSYSGGRRVDSMRLCYSFHGTPSHNFDSIFERGLLIPGSDSGVCIANGRVHGDGIYSADNITTSLYYAKGTRTILICGLVNEASSVSQHGNIYVCTKEAAICPLWLLNY
eukprot:m.56324 g.56324  ORF g.56324 m.56324 type:complete len:303 (+) comp7796_c0_seq1:193-1101(+)